MPEEKADVEPEPALDTKNQSAPLDTVVKEAAQPEAVHNNSEEASQKAEDDSVMMSVSLDTLDQLWIKRLAPPGKLNHLKRGTFMSS